MSDASPMLTNEEGVMRIYLGIYDNHHVHKIPHILYHDHYSLLPKARAEKILRALVT